MNAQDFPFTKELEEAVTNRRNSTIGLTVNWLNVYEMDKTEKIKPKQH